MTVKLRLDDEDREIALGERAVRILQFIALHAQEIEAITHGSLTLNFAGRHIKPLLTRSFRPLPEDPAEQ